MILHVDNAAGVSFQHSTCGNTQLKGIFKMTDDWVKELKDEDKIMLIVSQLHRRCGGRRRELIMVRRIVHVMYHACHG